LHGTHHCLQTTSAAASACGGSKRKICSRRTASSFSMLTTLLQMLQDDGSASTQVASICPNLNTAQKYYAETCRACREQLRGTLPGHGQGSQLSETRMRNKGCLMQMSHAYNSIRCEQTIVPRPARLPPADCIRYN
jgi:hypothetical protein